MPAAANNASHEYWEFYAKIAYFLTPAALLLATALYALNAIGAQPYLSVDLVIAGGFAAIGLIIGALVLVLPLPVRYVIFGVLVGLFLDVGFALDFSIQKLFVEYAPDAVALRGITKLLVLYAFPTGVIFVMGRNRVSVLLAVAVVIILSLFIFPTSKTSSAPVLYGGDGTKPLGRVVIDMLLDEYVGVDGIPGNSAESDVMRKATSDFFVSRGFRIYSAAYSSYPLTVWSIPAFLWLDDPAPNSIAPQTLERRWGLDVPWFNNFLKEGFHVFVYTFDSLPSICPFEKTPGVDCSVYGVRSFTPEAFTDNEYLFALTLIFDRLSFKSRLCAIYKIPTLCAELAVIGPENALQIPGKIAETIKSASGDIVIFAHILLPHYPYIYREDCSLNPTSYFHPPRSEEILARYYAQINCTLRGVDTVLNALRDRGALDRATITIHGDHGLRSGLDPFDADERQWISHSTLFAVKSTDVTPGVDDGFYRAQSLFAAIYSHSSPKLGDGSAWEFGKPYAAGVTPPIVQLKAPQH